MTKKATENPRRNLKSVKGRKAEFTRIRKAIEVCYDDLTLLLNAMRTAPGDMDPERVGEHSLACGYLCEAINRINRGEGRKPKLAAVAGLPMTDKLGVDLPPVAGEQDGE